jgi:DNA primase
VINLLPYKDPDEFIKELGAVEFQNRINSAENGFMYEVRSMENLYDMKDPSGKGSFIRDVASRMIEFDNPVEADIYAGLIAEKYNISYSSMVML